MSARHLQSLSSMRSRRRADGMLAALAVAREFAEIIFN